MSASMTTRALLSARNITKVCFLAFSPGHSFQLDNRAESSVCKLKMTVRYGKQWNFLFVCSFCCLPCLRCIYDINRVTVSWGTMPSFVSLLPHRKTIHQRDDMNADEKVGMIIISWYTPTAHKTRLKDFISHHKYEQWTACSLQVPTRGKALQGWTRPSIDELGVPTESWAKVHRNLLNVARNFVSLIHLFVQMNSKHKGTTSLGTFWELFT